ncbi:membrane progestin receptor beta [Labeo rohita]|uniref:Membrane progestin receptor beta n=1 Tax=Labeo rohita TaxID=84645 RepID=A0A498M7D8_LABRO|nr:membrane progestin receptor beta isoform X1 [Labeo rohita]RXN06330.1 membrane progestin receptor beta [Labeo rohita]RXN16838.1 membrane progestin receptor beta [Labeo rohita]
MSSGVLGRLSTLTLSIQQLGQLPHLSNWLPRLPLPQATVLASDVPSLFREPYILSGYRPVHQEWRSYFCSLFQCHNESLNVWTHLLAIPAILLQFSLFAGTWGLTLNVASLPLFLYVLSSLTYLSFSVAAHLLQSHSELSHYSLFFVDYVGVAVYQYGCSLGHYFYCSEPVWRHSLVGVVFLPGAAVLAWLSCTSCCYAKFRYRRPYPPRRKICQIIPTSLAYLLDISPVAHRLVTKSWDEPVLVLHALQVVFFMLAALFFSCPVPERFFPGRCDIVGHGHQIFHIFLAMCTMCQLEAMFRDFLVHRESVVDVHGEHFIMLAGGSFFLLVLCSVLTAVLMRGAVQRQLKKKD